jgi:PPP family 3-phenylpropionic acid transporter
VPAIRVLFLLVGAILGVFYPFVPAILLELGFSPEEIGLTTAIAALAFTISVPIFGHFADVVLGRVAALRVAAIGSSVAVLGLLLEVPPLAVALLIVAYAAFESALAPLSDALAVNALARAPRAYARTRMLSSLGFAGASVLAGLLYNRTGFAPASVLWALIAAAIVVVTRWVPDVERFRGQEPAGPDGGSFAAARRSSGRGGSFVVALRTQPRLRGLLLGLGLVHVGMLAGFTFLALRILGLGGQASDVALSAGFSAVAEIPAMLLMPRILARIGVRALLVAGIVLYGLVMASWAVLDDPGLIIATRALSGVAYAAIAIAAVLTIAALLPPELQGTGQGLYQTVGFGVSAIVANALGGLIYGAGGALPLFLGCAALAGLGAVVAWRTVPARAAPSGPVRSGP